jgi:hypothetical protein
MPLLDALQFGELHDGSSRVRAVSFESAPL